MHPAGILSDTVYGADDGSASAAGNAESGAGDCGIRLLPGIYEDSGRRRRTDIPAMLSPVGHTETDDDRCFQPAMLLYDRVSGHFLDKEGAV